MTFSRSTSKPVVFRKATIAVSGPASSSTSQSKWGNGPRQITQAERAAAVFNSPRQIAQAERVAAVLNSPRQVAQAKKAAVQFRGGIETTEHRKPLSQAYWAAKKRDTKGRELRYWHPGIEDSESTRRAGWYGRDFFGGWGESSPFVSGAPLDLSALGVEALPRIAPVGTPSNELFVVHEQTDFFAVGEGRERSGRSRRGMPQALQVERFGEIVSWCQKVDSLIELFEQNEKDVTKWRNRLGALSGAQVALGMVGGGLIIAGIVATGGLAAIPMAVGGIAIAASSAAAGVGVGAARAVAERGLSNAQHEGGVQHGKAVVGGQELSKGAGAVGAKEGLSRGLMAASHVGVAEAIGATAGGGGAALSVVKGGMGIYKAATVNVGAVWNQVDWGQALQNVVDAEAFLERHSRGFNPGMLLQVKSKLKATGESIFRVSRRRDPRWS